MFGETLILGIPARRSRARSHSEPRSQALRAALIVMTSQEILHDGISERKFRAASHRQLFSEALMTELKLTTSGLIGSCIPENSRSAASHCEAFSQVLIAEFKVVTSARTSTRAISWVVFEDFHGSPKAKSIYEKVLLYYRTIREKKRVPKLHHVSETRCKALCQSEAFSHALMHALKEMTSLLSTPRQQFKCFEVDEMPNTFSSGLTLNPDDSNPLTLIG